MANNKGESTNPTGLRRQAEDLLLAAKQDVAAMPLKDVQQLVHELQVHQVELDMQNDELRRTQVELEAARDRYEDLSDFSPTAHLTMDTHGTIVEANLRAGTLLGSNRQELIGQPLARFVASEDQDIFHRHCQDVLKTGARHTLDLHLRSKPGAISWVQLESLATHDESGPLTHWRTALLDISERKRVEAALRKSEDRYRSIFENAVDGIFQTTPDGKYVAVNPALARIYGYDSPNDMIATIRDIAGQLYVDPERRDEFIRLMEAHEEVIGFEALVYRKDGSCIWISESARTMRDQAGTLVGYEGTVKNITERKRADERLRATIEEVRLLSGSLATAQEEERTRIARELHDELGVGLTCLKIDLSRLAAIVGDDISGAARAKLDDKVRSMVEHVDGTIASVQRLVTQLRPALLDDLGLVAAIEWQCQDFQKRTGIPCTCVTNTDDIAMDAKQATALFRICQEALTNTARHAQATAATVKLESWNNSLRLVVADNGRGIPDGKVADRRALGLLGMKERAALFGGELTIQGHLGKGTTITVCLPQYPA